MDLESHPDVVIRAGRRDDLLALLAIRLGFHPMESLLVGSLDGPRSRLGFVLRVDLPDRAHMHQQVTAVVEVLRSQGVERVVVVAVGVDDSLGALVDLAVDGFAGMSIEVVEALVADGQRWWCRLCPDSGCGDPEGTAYDLSCSPAMAQAVLAGVAVLPSRTVLAEGFAAVPGSQRDAVAAAVNDVQTDLRRRWHRHGSGRPLQRTPALLTRGAARVRRLVAAGLPDARSDDRQGGLHLEPIAIAELAVWTDLVPVRDVAWSLMERASASHHAALWAQVARYAPLELSAAPLGLAGFASWLHGDGAAAWCAVERCLSEHPDYSMGRLLASTLERAVPPAMWTPPPDDLLHEALDPPAEFDDPAA